MAAHLAIRTLCVGCYLLVANSSISPLLAAKHGSIRRLSFDPEVPLVDLYDGIEQNLIKNPHGGDQTPIQSRAEGLAV